MNQRHISLIGAPTDIGAGARGASMWPEALRVAGLAATLEGHGLEVQDRGNLAGPANPCLPPVDGYRHLNEVVAWNELVHEAVLAELRLQRLPILLGGEHCLPDAVPVLDNLVSLMNENPLISVAVSSSADSRMSAYYTK